MTVGIGAGVTASIRIRAAAALVTCLLVLVACDPSGEPRPGPSSPSSVASPALEDVSGWDVALVLAPPGGVAGLDNRTARDAADAVEDDASLDVAGVRVLEPPTEPFRRDQLAFAAESGAQLVCTLGDDGGDDIAALAPRFPRTRFCLLGGNLASPPPNVIALQWDVRAGAFLAGAAAALSRPDAGVGIVVASPSPTFEQVRTGFDAGARTVRPEVRLTVATAATGEDARPLHEEARGAATGLYEGPPPVRAAMPYGAPDLAVAVTEVFTPDGFLVGWGADLAQVLEDLEDDDEAGEHVVVSVVKRFDLALSSVIAHLQEGAVLPSLGVEAFRLEPGGATDAYEAIRPRLEQLVEGIASGGVQTDVAPPPTPSPGPS